MQFLIGLNKWQRMNGGLKIVSSSFPLTEKNALDVMTDTLRVKNAVALFLELGGMVTGWTVIIAMRIMKIIIKE